MIAVLLFESKAIDVRMTLEVDLRLMVFRKPADVDD